MIFVNHDLQLMHQGRLVYQMNKFLYALTFAPVFTIFCSNAFIIDYDAINDDDNVDHFGTSSINYSTEGYCKEDGSKIFVHHDKYKGIYQDKNSSGGLKLEGVNKNDLELLHHGNELYKEYGN